ncbi:Piso0_004478 [Millerozyma farinosa CBS 7064]|uniref:DASH complex subunit DAD2 n=1 Tax=Pichia sorbitophila (strain ATCC MYA-4447 / BCRC 22081 / CBS 7064 / NBRC 10061 / NRRL Y-12695) TaxID=559304 RepID=G8Y5K2_PICSO|nr:Piso0_004478 [Millerozyma farinosa CBS 7064]CCE84913.1 Piso0_004478 [Millerozyma farinosa CBS 7064]
MDRKTVLKSSHIQQKITEKRAELENLNEIKRFTAVLTNQLDQLQDKLNLMADGTESVALVLSNWQNVIKSVSLASLGLLKYTEKDYEEGVPLPEGLVRIKLDKDQEEESEEYFYSEEEHEESVYNE